MIKPFFLFFLFFFGMITSCAESYKEQTPMFDKNQTSVALRTTDKWNFELQYLMHEDFFHRYVNDTTFDHFNAENECNYFFDLLITPNLKGWKLKPGLTSSDQISAAIRSSKHLLSIESRFEMKQQNVTIKPFMVTYMPSTKANGLHYQLAFRACNPITKPLFSVYSLCEGIDTLSIQYN